MKKNQWNKNLHKVSAPLRKIIVGTSWFGNKTLNGIERAGNKLPRPFFLFVYLIIILMFLSLIFYFAFPNGVDLQNVYDKNQGKILDSLNVKFYNFFSSEGIIWWLKNFIPNFMSLSTIGIVLITGLCAMVAEKSGFIDVGLKKIAYSLPKKALTPIIIMLGTISSIVSDAGYLILIPLAGVLYHKVNRHPIIGIVAMFAGVSAGFAANFIPASSEFILVSSTNQFMGKDVVNALSNWYFTMLLIVIYTLAGWFVTEKIVAKRIEGRYLIDKKHDVEVDKFKLIHEKYYLKPKEKLAMWWVLAFVILYLAGIIIMIIVPGAPFNATFNTEFYRALKAQNPNIANDYNVLSHLVLLIGFLFLGIGIIYGYVSRSFKTQKDFVDALIFGFKRIVPSLLIFIIMAQFIGVLSQSKLDMTAAYFVGIGVKNLPPILLILIFIIIVSIINLVMGGLSSKWFILGPIFVIALEQANIHPAATIMAYRIGDSATNVISPIMVYFPMILGFAHEWLTTKSQKDFKTGSLLSLMAPYSFFFLLASAGVFLIWFGLGIPVGVDGPIYTNTTLLLINENVLSNVHHIKNINFHEKIIKNVEINSNLIFRY